MKPEKEARLKKLSKELKKTRTEMTDKCVSLTVAELKESLSSYPDDMGVVMFVNNMDFNIDSIFHRSTGITIIDNVLVLLNESNEQVTVEWLRKNNKHQ